MSIYNRFEEATSSLIGLAMVVGSFLLWCYGIAICWQFNQIFWLVVSVFFPPVGFVIGAYNVIF